MNLWKFLRNLAFLATIIGAVSLFFKTYYGGKTELLQYKLGQYEKRTKADSLIITQYSDSLQKIKSELYKYTSKEILPPTKLCAIQGEKILNGLLVVHYVGYSGGAIIRVEAEQGQIFNYDFRAGPEQRSFKYKNQTYLLNFQGFLDDLGKCITVSVYKK
ncbi:MAG: hypothetical protein OEV55_07700 [candidate division Zixibacteria bacterium]|nr:hypothetical protein [candidate division Zixibacteria bacterium]